MKNSLLLTASVVFITSCGGGGGGGGSEPSAPAPQNITVSLTSSADSAEVNSSITLTWSSTLATSCSASGAWSGSKGTSGSESITIGVGGSNTFSLSCSATGANSGSASTTVNGLRYFDGKVFDGYIRGAEVFVDTNDNLTLDANEASVTTDNQGGFTNLLFGNGTLVSKGGFDLDTGAELSDLTLVHKLDGYEASKLASPFTTLIAYMDDASTINAALGIDASINLLTTDPIPNLGEGIYDQMYEKGNQLTVIALTLQNYSADSSSKIYFQAIANQLEKLYLSSQSAINIEDDIFIGSVIDEVETLSANTLNLDAKRNLNTIISSVIPFLAVKGDPSVTTSIQRFAFSTLQDDVKNSEVMLGSSSATIAKYTNQPGEYIAQDQGISATDINNTPTIMAGTDCSGSLYYAPSLTTQFPFIADENQTSIPGCIVASDLDGDPLSYSISGSEIIISSSGILSFVSAPDYETKNLYTATVTVSDGKSSVIGTIEVSINDIDESPDNNLPSITSSSNFSAAENQTSIGSIGATDLDGDSLIYSISGSEINISSSGVLTFASIPDYETKNSYSATVTVSDGTDSVTQAITVTITDVDETVPNAAPTISSSATFSAAENQTAIGSVTATDADGNSLTYSISGSEINISSSGVLTFATAPDYETKTSYTATVTVSDGTDSVTQAITVTITDVVEAVPNAAPTISSSATFSAAENQTAIGSVTATDADGDSLTYSISGSEINISSSGVLTFVSAPDYETKTSYSATVTVSDGTASTTQDITVNITDVNEAPTISSSSTFTIAENQTSLGSVTATDPENQTLTYALIQLPAPLAGEQYAGASINSSTGVITLGGTGFNYEERTSITARIEVSDGTNAVTQDITVSITDLPQGTVTQLGSALTSSSVTFEALALSGNGLTLVYRKDIPDTDLDSVAVVSYQLGSWSQIGSDIVAEAGELGFGNSVAISDDGTIIAIGVTPESDIGLVKVYKHSSGSWSQLGSDISGIHAGDYFGYATSLSNDGTILAIGATDIADENNGPGAASVYQYSTGAWTQLGSTINGVDANDWFGRSVSLSGNGQILAIGSDRHDGGKGEARIYQYDSGSWSQLGSDINGNTDDRLGRAVSLSDDGSIIALGNNPAGQSKVFQYDSGSWSQLGSNITSSNPYIGLSATISDDGTRVTFGGIGDTDTYPGSFVTYKFSSNNWTSIASVSSSNVADQFGWATSTSNDGSIVAAGDYNVNGDSNNALAKIYKVEIEN